MRIIVLVVAAGLAASGCLHVRTARKGAEGLVLAKHGRSEYRIVVADEASPSTKYGAQELQRFLKEMTGAELPIVSDAGPLSAHEIILGDNKHSAVLSRAIDYGALGDEGYALFTLGSHLVIAGGELRGNMYGVYGLLEDHLGCRWFTPTVSRIPKQRRLVLPPLDEMKVPVLEYREPFVIDCFDGDWCARNGMNSSSGRLEARHGGKVRFGAGMFVHTSNMLVPPEKYFDEHPEYFSEVDGKRVKDRPQLCCTNEDVIRLCTEAVREHMRADPEAFVFSVSQNDWDNHCECAQCQALAAAEESQMAPVLHLVNRVAEAIEAEFPDKAVETLAYQWTRKPPKTMRPRHNVIVRLCSIECCFMHPLATCDSKENREFRSDVEGWATVADRLWVWDYVTSFAHYFCPFPNHRILNDNIQFYIKNNVRGIFEQDTYTSLNGELSPLGGYIIAKYLWNPAYDEDTAINEFLAGVYGKAAKPIRKYVDMLHEKVTQDNIHEHIWVGPVEAEYLTDEILAKADLLWDKAERAVAHDPAILERVKAARLPVDYAFIERACAAGIGLYQVDQDKMSVTVNPAFEARVRRFSEVAERNGVTWMNEGRTTFPQYKEKLEGLLKTSMEAVPFQEPAGAERLVPGLRYACYEGAFSQLPDFAALTPAREGCAEGFDLSLRTRPDQFAMRFTGYIKVSRTGVYAFHLQSNDGSRLYIGGTKVVDNDGPHGAQEVSGFIGLKAGLYPITVEYYDQGGTQALRVLYSGPGIERERIAKGVLFREP
jgi:hypothetical protein